MFKLGVWMTKFELLAKFSIWRKWIIDENLWRNEHTDGRHGFSLILLIIAINIEEAFASTLQPEVEVLAPFSQTLKILGLLIESRGKINLSFVPFGLCIIVTIRKFSIDSYRKKKKKKKEKNHDINKFFAFLFLNHNVPRDVQPPYRMPVYSCISLILNSRNSSCVL